MVGEAPAYDRLVRHAPEPPQGAVDGASPTPSVPQRRAGPAGPGDLRDQLLRVQRGAGNRATAGLAGQLGPRRRLQRVTYAATPISGADDQLWAKIGQTIKDWSEYARRAQKHVETMDSSRPEYDGLKERIDAHVRLAGVFEAKYNERYAPKFVVVTRDGVIGALMIAETIVNHVFLDDLWSNPRKALSLSEADAAAVRGDLSGAAAMEYVIKWARDARLEIRLLGGDRSAREFYWKNYGFGVRVNPRRPEAKGGPKDPVDYGRHHAVEVNPQEGTTERSMVLPLPDQMRFLSDLDPASSGPTSSWKAWENWQKRVGPLLPQAVVHK
jgi:hypothetical protein